MVAKAVVITMASSAIMKDASEVTPSTQFFALAWSISVMVVVSAWVTRAGAHAPVRARRGGGDEGFGRKFFYFRRILLLAPNVLAVETPKQMEKAMRRTLIRYKAKPEASDRNVELVSAVFAELQALAPDGVRYLTLRLDDDTFIHLVESTADDGSTPIPKLAAFQAFQSGIRERCAEPPLVRDVTIVGNYRMLEADPEPRTLASAKMKQRA
jgi:hypothetical protein